MYLGYMKRGVSLMGIFCAICFSAGFFNMMIITMVLPVVWAYSFFDAFHIKNQTDEQVQQNPDEYLVNLTGFMGENWQNLLRRRHGLFGGILIFLGVSAIYNNFIKRWIWDLHYTFNIPWLGELIDGLPTLVVAILLIGLGFYLLKSPQKKWEEVTDFTPFKGVDSDQGEENDDE